MKVLSHEARQRRLADYFKSTRYVHRLNNALPHYEDPVPVSSLLADWDLYNSQESLFPAKLAVYLCGPMSGYPEHNYPLFDSIQNALAQYENAFRVINPTAHTFDLDGPDDAYHEDCIFMSAIDILTQADCLFVFGDYNNSKGCKVEIDLALAIGLPVYYLDHKQGTVQTLTKELRIGHLVETINKQLDQLAETPGRVQPAIQPTPSHPASNPQSEQVTVADEAKALVRGERRANYGHPLDDFGRTAGILNAVWRGNKTYFVAEDIPFIMWAVKMSRMANKMTRDSLVDMVGYALTLEMCEKERVARSFPEGTDGKYIAIFEGGRQVAPLV